MLWLVEAQVLLGKVFWSDLVSWNFELPILRYLLTLECRICICYHTTNGRLLDIWRAEVEDTGRRKLPPHGGGSLRGSIPIVGLESCDKLRGKGRHRRGPGWRKSR